MSVPSQYDRIEIWRYTYSRSSLVEAREAAKYLLANPGADDQVKQAMLCQIVIAYARPFTKSQVTRSERITPLPDDVIPPEFRQIHSENLQMRDKTFGHKDANAFPSNEVNKVLVGVDNAGFDLHTVSPFTMLDPALQQTILLCDRLIEHCVEKVGKYAHHFHGVRSGAYVMSTESNPAEWLIPWAAKPDTDAH